MKKIFIVIIMIAASAESSTAQNINWRSLREDQQNIIQFNFGYDFGVTSQISYSRATTIIKPVVFSIDYSNPMGNIVLDDFKVRFGGQVELVEFEGFSVTAKIYSNFRRFKNALVRTVGFGSDFTAVAGYFSPTWHAAGEFGFDKSIISHIQHSDIMKNNFPRIKDGWYIPLGGHYYYGIQGSKTLGETMDISMRLGFTKAQFNDEDAVLPVYVQVGTGFRF